MNTENQIQTADRNEARLPYQTPKLVNLGPVQAFVLATKFNVGSDGSFAHHS